ncbi:MAG: polyprenyl synthetase family protein [Clostridia bacterium]|nr:polyprenyl synthetase family protein [Clostridia bacterium]
MPFNIEQVYNQYFNKFEALLADYLNNLDQSISKTIQQAIEYSMTNGGKRVRAVLLLASADYLGVDFEQVKYFAIALELIQAYSLVHDDLPAMDNDDYRRGKLSTHKKFGEAVGILAGDALLNLAVETCLKKQSFSEKDVEAMKLIFDFSGYKGMVAGQVLDLQNEKNSNANQDVLYDIYLNKSVKMIMAPLLCASILSGHKYYSELKQYGMNLGFAFQIQDDIIDVEGNLEQIGKTPNKDVQVDKLTSIKVFGIDGAKSKAKEFFDKTLKSVENLKNNEFFIHFANMLNKRKY